MSKTLFHILPLGTFCIFAVLISVTSGAADITIGDSLRGLLGRGDPAHIAIVQEIRLPRAILAVFIGAGLGASGAALQGFTRNALAAPGILGFSACATLGAVTALYFGMPDWWGKIAGPSEWVSIAALTGAAAGSVLIISLSRKRQGAHTLILAGVGVGAFATALTGLLMNMAPNPWALSEIVYWMMGSLKNAGQNNFWICAILTTIGTALLLWIGQDLKTLSLGELTAQSLGVSISKVQFMLIAGTALCVGSGVAVAGTIGFVGLFVPHIVRMFYKVHGSILIGFSALAGGGFLVFADMLTRLLSGPGTPLYLGILTSLIGVPFFLWLAIKEPSP